MKKGKRAQKRTQRRRDDQEEDYSDDDDDEDDNLLMNTLKNKGKKSDLNNYRGISLLSIMSRLIAKVIANRVSKWAETNGHLSDWQ